MIYTILTVWYFHYVMFAFQLVVRAYDSFYPQDFVEERVVIDVTRNEFAPEYINTPYRVTIDEDTPVGRAVIDVNATDRNGVCMQFVNTEIIKCCLCGSSGYGCTDGSKIVCCQVNIIL